MRRRVRAVAAGAAVSAFIAWPLAVAALIFLEHKRADPLSVWGSLAGPAAIFAVAAGTSAIVGYWRLRRLRWIRDNVPRHGGLVCPTCHKALPNDREQGTCPKCGSVYAAEVVRAYWEEYAHSPQSLAAWDRRKLLQIPGAYNYQQMVRRRRLMALGGVAGGLVSMLLVGTIVMRQPPTRIAMQLISNPAWWVLPVSIAAGYAMRVGRTRHCAKCGYQKAPDAPNPPRCPECGSDWSSFGGTVYGEPVRRYPWIAYGVGVVVLLLVVAPITPIARHVNLNPYRLLPNSALISIASSDPYSGAWQVLTKRNLLADEKVSLATALLERCRAGDYLGPDARDWLARQATAGALPEPVAQRYYRDRVKLWIEGPQKARVNESITLGLGCTYYGWQLRPASTGADCDYICIGGFFVGDSPEPLGRSDRWHYASLLETLDPRGQPETPHERVQIRIMPAQAGALRIRAVLWLVVEQPGALASKVQWDTEGDPVVPPTAAWAERVELEHVIQVQP